MNSANDAGLNTSVDKREYEEPRLVDLQDDILESICRSFSKTSRKTKEKKEDVGEPKKIPSPPKQFTETDGVTKTSVEYNDLPPCISDLPDKLKKFAKDYTKDPKDTGTLFELYVCEVLKYCGYKNATWTGMSGDRGCDIELKYVDTRNETRKTVKVVIQCKYRTKGVINKDAINEARDAKMTKKYDLAWCIISTRFKEDALEKARRDRVTAIDGEQFYKKYLSVARNKGFKY